MRIRPRGWPALGVRARPVLRGARRNVTGARPDRVPAQDAAIPVRAGPDLRSVPAKRGAAAPALRDGANRVNGGAAEEETGAVGTGTSTGHVSTQLARKIAAAAALLGADPGA